MTKFASAFVLTVSIVVLGSGLALADSSGSFTASGTSARVKPRPPRSALPLVRTTPSAPAV
jgi:hypothetical protein